MPIKTAFKPEIILAKSQLRLVVGLSCIVFSACVPHALAHEMWLSPQSYQVAPGDALEIDSRVGEFFKGDSYRYIPANFTRFDLVYGDDIRSVASKVGDLPSVKEPAAKEGLVIGLHESSIFTVTYPTMEKFESFAGHKDFPQLVAQHRERGLPEKAFREAYTRHAKSLIAVGNGEGEDRNFGMEIEIVALENPYTDNMGDGIDLEVFYQGKPRSDSQVEVFEKVSGDDGVGEKEDVNVLTLRTDASGKVTLPVRPGYEYLVDSVVIREPSAELAHDNKVVWESVWASLTFEIPSPN